MTTAPNIEMIAALLRSCRLGTERGIPSPAAGVVCDGGGGVAVELNSETALPFHWEQCLDMQTGELYYFNRETGTRTSKDPRVAAAAAAYSSSYLSEEDVSSSDSFSAVSNGNSRDDTNEDSVDSTANSCLTSISSASSPATAAEPLVSAGCRSCFMYFMVPKSDDACPKCGGHLFKLGRHGNA